MGEGITKKESDLAADVEEQQQALQAKAAEKKDQPAAAEAPEPQQPQQPAIKVNIRPCLVFNTPMGCTASTRMDPRKGFD